MELPHALYEVSGHNEVYRLGDSFVTASWHRIRNQGTHIHDQPQSRFCLKIPHAYKITQGRNTLIDIHKKVSGFLLSTD